MTHGFKNTAVNAESQMGQIEFMVVIVQNLFKLQIFLESYKIVYY